MNDLINALSLAKDILWGGPLLILLVGVGLFLTVRLRGLQIRMLGHALSLVLFPRACVSATRKSSQTPDRGDISPFKSLMTALAGAIGTGNITGIAMAIGIGGFGSLFWMWVIAFFGMVTAYAEALLAVRFRRINQKGEVSGGPMHTLTQGLGMKKLASAFCIFGIIASFGIGGTVQSNSVAAGLHEAFGIAAADTGLVMAIVTAIVLVGGIRSIGLAAGVLVPFMALTYVGAGLIVLILHWEQLPAALLLIVQSAFQGQAALGGFAGAGVLAAIQQGVSNGIFANEAGLGSLAIAAASAQTEQPARQGMLAISGVFFATMIICTFTGLVLAVTQVLGTLDPQGQLISGSALTMAAFQTVRPELGYVVVFGLIFFAFTTILAWAYYGEKCLEYLFGSRVARFYRWVYTVSVFFGAIMQPQLVWILANLANGLMAIPNLIAVFRLLPIVEAETQSYLVGLSTLREGAGPVLVAQED